MYEEAPGFRSSPRARGKQYAQGPALSTVTAYSMADWVPWQPSPDVKGGTRLATLRHTNMSPGSASNTTAGSARLSQHDINQGLA